RSASGRAASPPPSGRRATSRSHGHLRRLGGAVVVGRLAARHAEEELLEALRLWHERGHADAGLAERDAECCYRLLFAGESQLLIVESHVVDAVLREQHDARALGLEHAQPVARSGGVEQVTQLPLVDDAALADDRDAVA